MAKPRPYEAAVRYVSLAACRQLVTLCVDLSDPTTKHGHRSAHITLTPEQARRWAESLANYAERADRERGPR